jgi:hypothetical protein
MAQQSQKIATTFLREAFLPVFMRPRRAANEAMCYNCPMTKLLDEAFDRLRELPEEMQEAAARTIIHTLAEEPERGDLTMIEEARRELATGEFSTHHQWRHEMGLGDR